MKSKLISAEEFNQKLAAAAAEVEQWDAEAKSISKSEWYESCTLLDAKAFVRDGAVSAYAEAKYCMAEYARWSERASLTRGEYKEYCLEQAKECMYSARNIPPSTGGMWFDMVTSAAERG